MRTEHFVWAAFVCAIVAIFVLSGDGRYRYPCQDYRNWSSAECKPPICTATRTCPSDLTGGVNVSE
jgi:hypothetical protein